MPDSLDLNPADGSEPALVWPETAQPALATDGPLTLQTTIFGPLTIPDGAAHAPEIEELSRRAAMYATRARGDGTRRAYRSAWRAYETWCQSLGRAPLGADPDTVAMYVVKLADAGLAVSSIRVHLAAIRTAHLLAGRSIDLRHPRLAMVVEGVTRSKGVRPRRKATPAVPGVLRLMLATCSPATTPLGARDRAMLLIGFGAALRRSEIVGLAIGDVELVPDKGLLLTIGRSKTDQHGKGQRVAVWANRNEAGFCPVAAFEAWIRHRREAKDLDWTATATMRDERPLFCAVTKTGRVTGALLSDKAVVRLIKQAAADAGMDPERFSGHSLRRGLLTAGGENQAQLADLMRQSRHRSAETVLGYIEPADLWRNNVTETVFGRGR